MLNLTDLAQIRAAIASGKPLPASAAAAFTLALDLILSGRAKSPASALDLIWPSNRADFRSMRHETCKSADPGKGTLTHRARIVARRAGISQRHAARILTAG